MNENYIEKLEAENKMLKDFMHRIVGTFTYNEDLNSNEAALQNIITIIKEYGNIIKEFERS